MQLRLRRPALFLCSAVIAVALTACSQAPDNGTVARSTSPAVPTDVIAPPVSSTRLTTDVSTEPINDIAEVSTEPALTSALAYSPGPDGATEIHWQPVYRVINKGDEPFLLQDLTLDFPFAVDANSGNTIDLVKARPMNKVRTYQSQANLADGRPLAEQKAPLSIEPGAILFLQVDEALLLTANGNRVMLPQSGDAVDYLGPFLRLPEEAGKFQCVANAQLDLTVETNHGSFTESVEQALLPTGCKLNLPLVTFPIKPRDDPGQLSGLCPSTAQDDCGESAPVGTTGPTT